MKGGTPIGCAMGLAALLASLVAWAETATHSWTGINPHYKDFENTNNVSPVAIDFSKRHIFGASYDPKGKQVAWWVDGVRQMRCQQLPGQGR